MPRASPRVLNPAASNTAQQSRRYQTPASLPCHHAPVLPTGFPFPLCAHRVFVVNFWPPACARTRALPRTDRLSQRLENLLHLAVQTLLFRQRQSTGRSRTRLAKAKSNRSLASPRHQAGGVCLPRSTLKAPAKTSLPPVSASHPPTRVGGSPRFAKLPPPHSWGGGARKGGGEVSEPGCHENQSSCPDYFRQHQRPGRSRTRLTKTKILASSW